MKKTLLALAAAFAAVGVQAATISDSYGVPVIQAKTEINQTGQLDKFDGSKGTLTGATLNIFGAATFEYGGTNNAAQRQTAELTSRTRLVWSSDLLALDGVLNGYQIALSDSSGLLGYASGQSRTFGPVEKTGTQAFDLSGILAALTGAGTFGLTCESVSGLLVDGGGGNISTTQKTQAGCGAEIVYEYTAAPPPAVPEPGSLALVGLALAGVAVSARRRKA